jgi:hypothetical protein
LQPGDDEEWRLKISGPKGEEVSAQLLTAMYDASLDHFVPHGWDMNVWPTNYSALGWARTEPFGANGGRQIWRAVTATYDSMHVYPDAAHLRL